MKPSRLKVRFTIHLFVFLFFLSLFTNNSISAQTMFLDSATINSFTAAEYVNVENDFKLNYRVYEPMSLENLVDTVTTKFPLIIFLHGAGERGDDNINQLFWGAKDLLKTVSTKGKEAFMLYPQCPSDMRWVQVDWADDSTHTRPKTISQPLGAVWSLVQKMKIEYPVDPNRIYVVGLSMGGYGTWDLLQRFSKEIAAAVPICGWGEPTKANTMLDTPIWAFHGAEDTVVPVARTRNMVKAIRDQGGQKVRYTEYPYVGHNSWSPTFSTTELWDWLFAQ